MKNRLATIGAAVCVAVAFGGCKSTGTQISYDNDEAYSIGERSFTESIANLDIEWISGSVTVVTHGESTVVLDETSKKDLSEDAKLRYWLDGETLRIRYAKEKRWTALPEKQLIVYLPQELALKKTEINAVSAEVTLTKLTTEKLEVGSVSGDVSVSLLSVAESVSVHSISGDVTLQGSMKDLEMENVSGSIEWKKTDAETRVEADIESISGGVTFYLPQTTGFTLERESVSGGFNCEFSVTQNGKTYVCGGGEDQYEIETISGGIKIKKVEA